MKDLAKIKELAVQRKGALKDLSLKFGFDARAVKKMHDVYLEQNIAKRIDYKKFLKFLKLDDQPTLKTTFEYLSGGVNEKMDIRVLMLMLMNVTTATRDEKLKFAFKIFDEEDSRMITYKELLKIL